MQEYHPQALNFHQTGSGEDGTVFQRSVICILSSSGQEDNDDGHSTLGTESMSGTDSSSSFCKCNEGENVAFWAFAGTWNDMDVKTDLDCFLETDCQMFPGSVHKGFFERAQILTPEKILVLLRRNGVNRLVLCGHSLGGAVAHLVLVKLRYGADTSMLGINSIISVGFGAPFFGDSTLSKYCDDMDLTSSIITVVNENDPVPRLLNMEMTISNVLSSSQDLADDVRTHLESILRLLSKMLPTFLSVVLDGAATLTDQILLKLKNHLGKLEIAPETKTILQSYNTYKPVGTYLFLRFQSGDHGQQVCPVEGLIFRGCSSPLMKELGGAELIVGKLQPLHGLCKLANTDAIVKHGLNYYRSILERTHICFKTPQLSTGRAFAKRSLISQSEGYMCPYTLEFRSTREPFCIQDSPVQTFTVPGENVETFSRDCVSVVLDDEGPATGLVYLEAGRLNILHHPKEWKSPAFDSEALFATIELWPTIRNLDWYHKENHKVILLVPQRRVFGYSRSDTASGRIGGQFFQRAVKLGWWMSRAERDCSLEAFQDWSELPDLLQDLEDTVYSYSKDPYLCVFKSSQGEDYPRKFFTSVLGNPNLKLHMVGEEGDVREYQNIINWLAPPEGLALSTSHTHRIIKVALAVAAFPTSLIGGALATALTPILGFVSPVISAATSDSISPYVGVPLAMAATPLVLVASILAAPLMIPSAIVGTYREIFRSDTWYSLLSEPQENKQYKALLRQIIQLAGYDALTLCNSDVQSSADSSTCHPTMVDEATAGEQKMSSALSPGKNLMNPEKLAESSNSNAGEDESRSIVSAIEIQPESIGGTSDVTIDALPVEGLEEIVLQCTEQDEKLGLRLKIAEGARGRFQPKWKDYHSSAQRCLSSRLRVIRIIHSVREKMRCLPVGIVGEQDVGKSYLVNKICEGNVRTLGTMNHTDVADIYKVSDTLILLDTPGVNGAHENVKAIYENSAIAMCDKFVYIRKAFGGLTDADYLTLKTIIESKHGTPPKILVCVSWLLNFKDGKKHDSEWDNDRRFHEYLRDLQGRFKQRLREELEGEVGDTQEELVKGLVEHKLTFLLRNIEWKLTDFIATRSDLSSAGFDEEAWTLGDVFKWIRSQVDPNKLDEHLRDKINKIRSEEGSVPLGVDVSR
eukprot:scaffold2364_cov335-Pinguiococcus_pyrenoidosus.AAC.6